MMTLSEGTLTKWPRVPALRLNGRPVLSAEFFACNARAYQFHVLEADAERPVQLVGAHRAVDRAGLEEGKIADTARHHVDASVAVLAHFRGEHFEQVEPGHGARAANVVDAGKLFARQPDQRSDHILDVDRSESQITRAADGLRALDLAYPLSEQAVIAGVGAHHLGQPRNHPRHR